MITATSVKAKAFASLVTMLANNTAFTDRLTAYASGVSATDRIYFFEIGEEIVGSVPSELRPAILLGIGDNDEYTPIRKSCPATLVHRGSIWLSIIDNARYTDTGEFTNGTTWVSGTDDPKDSYLDFINFSYGVMDAFNGVFTGPNDQVGFQSIELVQPPWRPEIEKRGGNSNTGDDAGLDDYWQVVFALNHGVI
jgi:hypothetical protein